MDLPMPDHFHTPQRNAAGHDTTAQRRGGLPGGSTITVQLSAKFTYVRQNRQISGPLYSHAQLSLMPGTIPAHPAGEDLPPVGNEIKEGLLVLVINILDLIAAKKTDPWSAEPVYSPF
jgi:hypothetical protein